MASKEIEEFVRRLRKQGYRMEVTPETDSHSSTYTKNKSAKSNSKGGDSFLGYTAERTWDNFKDVFKNIHKNAQINASAGYGEDVLKQLDKLKESSAGKGWNKKGIEQLEQAFRSSIEQTRKEKDERGIEEIKRVQQNQNELDENIEQKYSGLTENQKKWGNRIASIGSILPSALAYAVPGGQAVSAGVTFGNISGDAIGNALLEGKTPREAQSYGYLEGLKEAAVEQAFGGVAGLSKKAGLSKGLNALLDNKVSNRAARTLLSRTGAATGEGLEEVVSTLAEPLVRKAAFNDEELQNVSLDDLKESFLGGATAAAILGTGQDTMNALRNRRAVNNISDKTSLSNEEVRNTIDNLSEAEPYQVAKQLKKQGTVETVKTPKQGNNLLMEAIYGGDIPQQKIIGLPDLETQIQENRANIENQKPIKIQGERFKMGTGTLKADVEQLFREHGNMVHNDVLGDVMINTKGVKDSLAHGMTNEKAALYEAIPSLIQNGKIVDYVENHKGRGYNSVVLEAPVTITKGDAKGDYIAEVIVHRTVGDKNQRYYLHDVSIRQKKTDSTSYPSDKVNRRNKPRSLSEEQVNPSSIDYNIQQDEKYVNSVPQNNDRSIDQLLVERLQLPMASNDDTSSIYNMLQDGNYVNDGNTGEDILFAETDNGKGTRQTAKRILGGESFVTNTTTDSDTRDLYREVIEANKNYTKKSFAKTEERAAKILEERGIDGAQAYLYKEAGRKGGLSVDDFTLAIETLRALEEQGGQNEAWVSMYKTIAENVHNAGQMLSFSKLLYKDGGSAAAMKLMNEVRQINAERGIDIQVDEAKFSELAQLKPGEEARAKELLTDLYAEIGQQVPSTWREKLNAWRYTAMLANVKTHVRNIAGNSGMWAMAKASNWIDGALQSVLIKNKN